MQKKKSLYIQVSSLPVFSLDYPISYPFLLYVHLLLLNRTPHIYTFKSQSSLKCTQAQKNKTIPSITLKLQL